MNHLWNARLESQVKYPGSDVTGLQKCFVKGKRVCGCTFRKKKQQFYLGIEKAELWVSVLYSLTDARDQDCREAHSDGSEESNWYMEGFTLRSPGSALIWTIRDQKVISILTLSSDLWMGVGVSDLTLENKPSLELQERSSQTPLREPHTSREQLILSKDRPKALPSAHAYVLYFFFPTKGAKIYHPGHQIFTHLRQLRGIIHRCIHEDTDTWTQPKLN